mmetsp:Transcript_2504/g.6905  ORF Transcript_2504/g.6905 Transcript_2504/m.6905 type:complete len:271 (-) Transcript_2504:34-846(-)
MREHRVGSLQVSAAEPGEQDALPRHGPDEADCRSEGHGTGGEDPEGLRRLQGGRGRGEGPSVEHDQSGRQAHHGRLCGSEEHEHGRGTGPVRPDHERVFGKLASRRRGGGGHNLLPRGGPRPSGPRRDRRGEGGARQEHGPGEGLRVRAFQDQERCEGGHAAQRREAQGEGGESDEGEGAERRKGRGESQQGRQEDEARGVQEEEGRLQGQREGGTLARNEGQEQDHEEDCSRQKRQAPLLQGQEAHGKVHDEKDEEDEEIGLARRLKYI